MQLGRIQLLVLIIILPFCLAAVAAPDELIETEICPLAGQLLHYDWLPLKAGTPMSERRLKSALVWADWVMASDFAHGPAGEAISYHLAASNTCDAIQIEYDRSGYHITIAQTSYCLSVVLEAKSAQFPELGDAATLTAFAGLLLQINHPIKLVVKKSSDALSFARNDATYSKDEMYEGGYFIRGCWRNGRQMGIFGLKIPKRGLGFIATTEIQANRIWFPR